MSTASRRFSDNPLATRCALRINAPLAGLEFGWRVRLGWCRPSLRLRAGSQPANSDLTADAMEINWARVLLIFNGAIIALAWLGRNDWSHRYIARTGRRLQSLVPGYRTNRILEQLLVEMKTTSGRPLRDAIEHLASGVEGLQGTLAMIHVRQKMYDRLLESATLTTDRHGELTWASEGFLQLCERGIEEVMKSGWISAIYPADREQFVKEWRLAVSDGRDFRMRHRYGPLTDGSLVLVETHAYAAKVALGSGPVGWVAIVRAIQKLGPEPGEAGSAEGFSPEPGIKRKLNLRLDAEGRCFHPENGKNDSH